MFYEDVIDAFMVDENFHCDASLDDYDHVEIHSMVEYEKHWQEFSRYLNAEKKFMIITSNRRLTYSIISKIIIRWTHTSTKWILY